MATVKDLTDQELLQWAKGEFALPEGITEAEASQEVFLRAGQPVGTIKEAKTLIQEIMDTREPSSREPEPSPSVEDAPPREILESAAPAMEVTNTTAPPAPVIPPEPAPTAAPKTPNAPVVDRSSATWLTIESNLNDYIDKMQPGRSHAGNEGVTQQTRLFRTLQMILRQKGSQFIQLWSWLLSVVEANRQGVFNERYLYRYFDSLTLPANDRRNFERLLNLMITTSNPKTRAKSVRRVDVSATMTGFRDSEMHQRMMEFYMNL